MQEFEPEQISFEDETLKFCRENEFTEAFIVLNKMITKFSLIYFDHSTTANCYESLLNLFRKRIGIILNDRSVRSCTIISKMSDSDPEYTEFEINKIAPKCDLPPLIELLDRLQHPEHDKIRFDLLKWLVSEEKLKDIDLESIPSNVFIVTLTLTFMVTEGFIDITEADIILLSLKHVEDGLVPEDLTAPNILNRRAFFVSFMFSKCLTSVAKGLKIIGLKKLVVRLACLSIL